MNRKRLEQLEDRGKKEMPPLFVFFSIPKQGDKKSNVPLLSGPSFLRG